MTPRERTIGLISDIARRHHLTVDDVMSRRRYPDVVRARHEAFAYLYRAGRTAAEIGRIFNRDHTTVLHGIKRVFNGAD